MTWGDLIRAGEVLTGLTLVSLAFPRMRRVFRTLCRFTLAHIPRWLAFVLAPVLTVCAFVPGQADELAILAVVLVPVLRSREARRELRTSITEAWKISNEETKWQPF